MPVSDLHRQVASLALAAARQHGFALGGGNALLAHGVISRPTQDVDLFTDQEHGVQAAAAAVEAALRGAGFAAERQDQTAGLTDIFPGMGEGLAEWIVTAPGGQQMALQLAYFERDRDPVITDIGPVLDLEDVMGGKVCALASRIEPRDYADVAAALQRYRPGQLIRFARRLDPGLTGRDFAEAGLRLDQMTDTRFAGLGLSQADVGSLRERFAAWPRDAEAIDRHLQAYDAAEHRPGPGQSPARGGREPHQDDPALTGPWQPEQDSAAEADRDDPEAEP
jgi:Nucleotidyl transferase AbiEii toxin, Type IV TA system